MKVSTVSCCPCSWPYFLTLSYISGRQDHNMEETVKPASLSLKSVNRSLCPSQGPPVSISSPSDTSESVKSPNMSTDSGFEGENNRPSLLQTTLPSPSKDMILSSWRSKMYSDGTTALNFDGSDSTSPKSPKKSTDDSDFNESPFDKKSVPSVGDAHSESDNECGSEHNCTFFSSDASWVRANNHLSKSMCDDKKLDSFKAQISAFSICLSRGSDLDGKCGSKNSRSHVEFGECLTCHKVHYIHCRNCVDCTNCSQDVKWCGTLSSIRECKDHVIYAEGEVDSENDYDIHCKPDTETDASDEKIFEGNYSDNETLSAYYVPSNVSVTTDEYHLTVKLPDEKKNPVSEAEESSSEEERDSPCLCHIGMCKSERCQKERSKYTTVLKPKAVRPPVNHNRMDYHSSLESLHSQHVVAVIGQHHDRLSAFHERPSSSLSQNEGMHYFFSRSLDMPPSESSTRHTTSQLSVTTDSNFPTSNSCLFSEASGHRSSLTDMSTIKRCDQSRKKHSAEAENSASNCREVENRSSHRSSSSSEVESPKTRTKRFSMPCDINKNEACHSQFSHYDPNSEPIHMTLEEVHTSLQTLNLHEKRAAYARSSKSVQSSEGKSSVGFLGSYLRQKKCKREDKNASQSKSDLEHKNQRKSLPVILKSAFNNFFGLKKNLALPISKSDDELPSSTNSSSNKKSSPNTSPFTNRALPPLPVNGIPEWDGTDDEHWTLGGSQSQLYDRESEEDFVRRKMDYAASIERVKDVSFFNFFFPSFLDRFLKNESKWEKSSDNEICQLLLFVKCCNVGENN